MFQVMGYSRKVQLKASKVLDFARNSLGLRFFRAEPPLAQAEEPSPPPDEKPQAEALSPLDLRDDLIRALCEAKPVLPEAFKDIPPEGWFSSEHRVLATEQWLRARHEDTPEFDEMAFLRAFCLDNPYRDGPLIVLAQKLADRQDRKGAVDAINAAMSISQLDLYAQLVARRISTWANDDARLDAELDAYLRAHLCLEPFKTLETTTSGLAYLCCPAWLPTPVGDINTTDAASMWLGPIATELRSSIIDGSYRYCSRRHCGHIANRMLAERGSEEAVQITSAHEVGRLDEVIAHPRQLILSHDQSCNLTCPSCRTGYIVARSQEQARLESVMENTILPLLKNAEYVNVTGSGDPFGSKHFRRLLKRLHKDEYPKLKIDLHTNGQLFDERAWSELGLQDFIRYVQISIDAANADTYKILRRGGDFGRLLKNLQFVKQLKLSGQIELLEFSMVVQARNFLEIPDFVRLGIEYCADQVSFHMIRNWGTFTQDEFNDEFIGSSSHRRHEEFLAVLKDPLLAHPPAMIGNMLSYVGKTTGQG